MNNYCGRHLFTDLVEGEALGADPRVLGVVLAIVEDLAVEILVGVVARLLVDAIESALGKKKAETIGFLLLLLELLLDGPVRTELGLPAPGGIARRRTHANGLSVIAGVYRCRRWLTIQLQYMNNVIYIHIEICQLILLPSRAVLRAEGCKSLSQRRAPR